MWLPILTTSVGLGLAFWRWSSKLKQVGVLQPIASWGVKPHGKFHRVAGLGVSCHYRIFSSRTDTNGDPKLIPGRVVLFLHGLGAHLDQLTWGRDGGFAQTLTDAGFSVLALDLLGHGFSEAPDSKLSPSDFQLQLDALLEKLQLSYHPLDVIGFSHGAFVASDFAAKHPKSVKSLTLMSPFGCHIPGQRFPPVAALFALVVHFMFEGNMSQPRSIYRVVLHLEGSRWLALIQEVLKAELPLMILAGTRDTGIIGHARYLNSIAPGSKLFEIEGAGHMSWATGTLRHQRSIRNEVVEFLQARS